jgi:hypothetical protein
VPVLISRVLVNGGLPEGFPKVAVAPFGSPDRDRLTCPEYPFRDVTDTKDEPEPALCISNDAGLTDRSKSDCAVTFSVKVSERTLPSSSLPFTVIKYVPAGVLDAELIVKVLVNCGFALRGL